MVKVIHVDDSGAEVAAVELDDFTVEIVYGGIAQLLREAATSLAGRSVPTESSRGDRVRRQRILSRLNTAEPPSGRSPLW